MIDNRANARAAYAGQLILTSGHAASMDSWATGLNNNVLVLGCSGSGKTRNFLKPNLLQCEGSYVVLDSKGRLYDEMAPYLRAHGYIVDSLDFTTMDGEIGYDPLHHVRWRKGRPLAQDIIAIASALFPVRKWATIRSGRAQRPTTLPATSPMCSRRCPIANGTWHRW